MASTAGAFPGRSRVRNSFRGRSARRKSFTTLRGNVGTRSEPRPKVRATPVRSSGRGYRARYDRGSHTRGRPAWTSPGLIKTMLPAFARRVSRPQTNSSVPYSTSSITNMSWNCRAIVCVRKVARITSSPPKCSRCRMTTDSVARFASAMRLNTREMVGQPFGKSVSERVIGCVSLRLRASVGSVGRQPEPGARFTCHRNAFRIPRNWKREVREVIFRARVAPRCNGRGAFP
jgi:hypothetical protein